MTQIVHIQTVVQTTFGVLDGEGNAIPQQPIQATVQQFSREAFGQAFDGIAAERDKAQQPPNPEAEPVAQNSNRAQRRARPKAKPTSA